MPNFTVTLNNALTAEVQTKTDEYNAEQTALKAALNPPQVHTNLDVQGFLDMRVTEIARSYRDQNEETSGARIKKLYNQGTAEQKAAVKAALGIS